MGKGFRGIFSIPQTPFNDAGQLLWDDLQQECDWIVRAGAHGLVYPVMASEYTVLSFPERVQGMNLAARAVNGRIPVVIVIRCWCTWIEPYWRVEKQMGAANSSRAPGSPRTRPGV